MKPVLLVIDVQKAFYANEEAAKSLKSAVQSINQVIALFREKGFPVISIQNIEEEWGFVPGSEGYDMPDDLNIEESDIHIHKTYRNSFNKTELLAKIRELGSDTTFITGFSAAHCVFGTYRGAEDNDLNPILVSGAVASGEPEHLKFVEELCEIITPGALAKLFS